MRRLLNVLLTTVLLGGSVLGGIYLQTLTRDGTQNKVNDITVGSQVSIDIKKPQHYGFNSVLYLKSVVESDGTTTYTPLGPADRDNTFATLRNLYYLVTMLTDNVTEVDSGNEEALNESELVDAGIIFLRNANLRADQIDVLQSWEVASSAKVQSFAKKYTDMYDKDNWDTSSSANSIKRDNFPAWRGVADTEDVIPDYSDVELKYSKGCLDYTINSGQLEKEYNELKESLTSGKYADLLVESEAVGDDRMVLSLTSTGLASINYTLGSAIAGFLGVYKTTDGSEVMAADGKYAYAEKDYHWSTGLIKVLYEAHIIANSYNANNTAGGPLEVFAQETNNASILGIAGPRYLSTHALYQTVVAEFLGERGLKPITPVNSKVALLGDPTRFGQGSLYWPSGVNESINVGKCIVANYYADNS